MVVPRLTHHLERHEYTKHRGYSCWQYAKLFRGFLAGLEGTTQEISQRSHAHTNPNGKSIERTGIRIVTLTRLHRGLIQIEHDGKTCHEEEEEYHPELFHTLVAAESLPEKAEQAEEERQHIEHVVSLILLQFVRQLFLIAIHGIVDEGDTSEPVSVFLLAIALKTVLTAGKVPHEVAPIHEVNLIGHEEIQVGPL